METCRRGHPRTPENVHVEPSGTRQCRPCRAHYKRERDAALRQQGLSPQGEAMRRVPNGTPAHVRVLMRTLFTDTCWLFEGHHDGGGYGRVSVDRVPRHVHRIVYEALVGPIPNGLEMDHLCRVRNCVNPTHLQPVTRAENIRRRDIAADDHWALGIATT